MTQLGRTARTYPFHDFDGAYARHPFHSRRKGGQSDPSPLAALCGGGGDSQQFDRGVPQAVGGDLVVSQPHREHPRARALHAGEPYERARKMVRERAERSVAKKRGRGRIEGDIHARFPLKPLRERGRSQVSGAFYYAGAE